jgi:outer membrane biosynthesis protein TonB
MKTLIIIFGATILISSSCKTEKSWDQCTVKPSPVDTNTVYLVVDSMAKYKNGFPDLMRYISSNFIYPKQQEYLQTKTTLTFIINRQGKIINLSILKKTEAEYTLFDKEMLRVFLTMPPWNPGKQKGEVINQQIILPIQLEIK